MKLGTDLPDLTYSACIHPAAAWRRVFADLRRYGPALKARIAPEAPFGMSLTLTASETQELITGERVQELAAWLKRRQIYVALIDGRRFGLSSDPTAAREDAFDPDWSDPRRLHYTLQLASILSELLPEAGDGGISTIPLAAKWTAADADARRAMARNIVRLGEALAEFHARTGRLMHLDIEPEAGGLIESTEQTIAFFQDCLLPVVQERMAGIGDASRFLQRHIRLCYDAGHFAARFEDPEQSLAAIESAGIGIGRVQLSSALSAPFCLMTWPRARIAAELRKIVDTRFPHQVIERRSDSELRSYPDLEHALRHIDEEGIEEWRIHLHVPIGERAFGEFGSTQTDLLRAVALACDRRRTQHLEIETYTWNLPLGEHRLDLVERLEREYRWAWLAVWGGHSRPISVE